MRIGVLIRASLISFAVTVCLSCESSEISQAETNSESSDNRILNLYDAFGKRHEQAIFDLRTSLFHCNRDQQFCIYQFDRRRSQNS